MISTPKKILRPSRSLNMSNNITTKKKSRKLVEGPEHAKKMHLQALRLKKLLSMSPQQRAEQFKRLRNPYSTAKKWHHCDKHGKIKSNKIRMKHRSLNLRALRPVNKPYENMNTYLTNPAPSWKNSQESENVQLNSSRNTPTFSQFPNEEDQIMGSNLHFQLKSLKNSGLQFAHENQLNSSKNDQNPVLVKEYTDEIR
jgi:hypothetical protein